MSELGNVVPQPVTANPDVGPNPGIQQTPESPSQSDETIEQRMWISPLIGTILLIAILAAGPLYGRLTSDGKIDAAIDRDAPQVNVTVDLPFEPETFHRETLSELGVFAGRDRDDPSKLRLRAVTQDNLDTIANLFWVEGIEPS